MRSVSEIVAGWGELSAESLIPLLQEVQAESGYVSRAALEQIAAALHVPVSRVHGAATFYNQFRFAPPGEHIVEVCRGTACHVKGSATVADHVRRRLQVRPDGNSKDGRFTVVTVACLGACSIAPVVRIDGVFHGHLTIEKLDALLDGVASRT